MTCFNPRWALLAACAYLSGTPRVVAQQSARPLGIADMKRFADVSDPQMSADGEWIVYSVATVDTARDRSTADVWLARWDGTRNRRLTWDSADEHAPRFVGKRPMISFLSSRGDPHDADQLWILPLDGGEARKLTSVRDGVNDYSWSPDGTRAVLAIDDSTVDADSAPHPIVLDRYQFKADVQGYLDHHRTHLWLLNVAPQTVTQLTFGDHDEMMPEWSPDGGLVLFSSKQQKDPDRTDNWDLYVMAPTPGATPRQLTNNDLDDDDPQWESRAAWSPDGKEIAFLQGGPDSLIYFALQRLAVVSAAGGPVRVISRSLDRSFVHPAWSGDGKWIYSQLEDDGSMILARVAHDGSSIQRVLDGRRSVAAVTAAGAHVAIVQSTVTHPDELFAIDGDSSSTARQLSDANSWLREIQLAEQEPVTTKSKDGTLIHGFVMRPVGYKSGERVPTILRLHGGPVSQWENGFELSWQMFAAHGYAVVGMNPRGSSGRGLEWAKTIFAHWGEKDVQDVLSGADYAVSHGIADPQRLGVGGWSYGGELTDYVIASDTRFKAAIAGAGIGNVLAGFGTDQYVREYTQELGLPWKHLDNWLRVSYPFLHADRIVTPTMFMVGDQDFNVPLQNSEQMYQALRALGVESQLVIYPGQYHGLTRPSFLADRLQRYLDWYDAHLGVDGH
ncbi:MAG TPA: S9 family peptidase [Gemmatimonadaceae bacterium]|nr:S9 family peptidase [Gemmatimonadaceae bacterium]